jgi:hypothetical protein
VGVKWIPCAFSRVCRIAVTVARPLYSRVYLTANEQRIAIGSKLERPNIQMEPTRPSSRAIMSTEEARGSFGAFGGQGWCGAFAWRQEADE